jgi:cyclopropane fatty-acyl-phospholipid synthase-like methyltransferase
VWRTLFHLAAHVTGISNSSAQVEFARQKATQLGLDGRCIFYEGDFLILPRFQPYDVIIGVESFSHAEDAGSFMRMASENLLPGGILILCDDFLARGSGNSRWTDQSGRSSDSQMYSHGAVQLSLLEQYKGRYGMSVLYPERPDTVSMHLFAQGKGLELYACSYLISTD